MPVRSDLNEHQGSLQENMRGESLMPGRSLEGLWKEVWLQCSVSRVEIGCGAVRQAPVVYGNKP